MDRADLEKRTKDFALKLVVFVGGLPKSKVTDVLGYQLLKSGTSLLVPDAYLVDTPKGG